MDNQELQSRWLAISAGQISTAVSAELGQLLLASRGDRRKAVAAGLNEMATRKILHAKEATEVSAIMELSSPAALAIVSVIKSLTSQTKASAAVSQPPAAAATKGDALFGGVGAVIGAGLGAGFGPIGIGIGAAVGAAVGVCIGRS
jgi:mannitol-1-phosphate/altronate dehydrogenase